MSTFSFAESEEKASSPSKLQTAETAIEQKNNNIEKNSNQNAAKQNNPVQNTKSSGPLVNIDLPSGDGKTVYDSSQLNKIKTEEISISNEQRTKKPVRSMYAVFQVEYVLGRSKKRETFKFKLYHNRVPDTVYNFVDLVEGNKEFTDVISDKKVKRPFYDGLIFHRVVKGFIMQTGDPKGGGTSSGPGYNIPLELKDNLVHDRFGVVSLARMGNESHGSQFFITFAPLKHLDGTNTVFGQVVDNHSVKVLEEIEKVKTTRGTDKPKYPVRIIKATIERIR